MQAASDRQKSYANLKCKPMAFQVGDRVMLKVLAKVGAVAYKLKLPQELSRVHSTFHVSNLKKCYSDEPLAVPFDGLHVDDKLHFVEELVEIMDREVKRLKQSRIPIVKIEKKRLKTVYEWRRTKGPKRQKKQDYPEKLTLIELQKIVSQLAILGENISQEDLNLKFLRSLPAEWNTHVVVWRNKPDLDTMSFNDLYNNFKIVEQEVKRTVTSSSNLGSQNMAFVSSPSSINEVNTVNIQVSTSSIPVTTASFNDNTANLSDATIYAFLVNQPNGSQLMHEDLEQIHEDDLEEMDLKWQLALLSMRARRYYQRTGKNITINGSDTAGYDKSKVECFNCHKMGHFARECRSPRHQEGRPRNQDSSRKTVNVEETSSKVMVAIDGAGFDSSFMADEEVPTNIALMAFLDLEKNEVEFCDKIAVLKRDASYKDLEIIALNAQVENLKKEKESNKIKIDSFENASKSLDKLIGSQIFDNNRKGVGFDSYNVVAPPPTGLFSPPTINLSNSGLEEFQQPEFEGYGLKVNKSVSENSFNETKKTTSAPIIEEWVSDSDEDECEAKETDNVQHKPEQANQPRKVSQNPKNDKTNWNEKKTQKLGVGFQVTKKACFVCGSFNHLIKDCDFHDKKMEQKPVLKNEQKGTSQREVRPVWNKALRTNHQNFSKSRRNFAPTTILTKSGLVPLNTARQSSSRVAVSITTARSNNTAAPRPFVNVARPRPNAFQKAHSPSRRPCYQQTALKNRNVSNKVNTAKVNFVNTAEGKRVTSVVGGKGINAVKSSACWGDLQVALKDTCIFDSGCSRHMTGNKSYLTNYEDYDGGFIAFTGSSKGGKITGKGKIRTGKLDFEDVYFVKKLKFNLFSVSQMCDRKNSVLFAEFKCLILSPEFKLPDENQVMLKIPRKDNMYSFDLNNIVPSRGLTCLFAKATNDESKMWHRRIGHVNFKTLNKLVKGNLVRGLPSKIFENDHTCVACQKGKQHKATCKSKLVNSFCGMKGIKREFSYARTPQQNRVAKRKNRTLIEAARTMLADSLLHITFWAEAVNIACYVQNRVLVTKPHHKKPYELLIGRTPIISFMRPFGCPISILNILDHLGKFDGKADEGFLVGYSINSKAFRVYNSRTRKVEENLHVNFLENKPNVAGIGPKWLFDIDSLTNYMNYQPVNAGNSTNCYAGLETNSDAGQAGKEKVPDQEYILLPLMHTSSYAPSSFKEAEAKDDAGKEEIVKPTYVKGDQADDQDILDQQVNGNLQSIFDELAISTPINAASSFLGDLNALENTGIFDDAYDDRDEGAEADYTNLETEILVSPIPSTRANKDHHKDQIIGEVHSAVQTRNIIKQSEAGLITFINKQRRTNHKDFQNCLFACFLSQMEPKKVTQALDDESWVEDMQEELLQFKLLNV
ncbi:ribonuclease H-like domain-containing protein [Tanacetum coccineum]